MKQDSSNLYFITYTISYLLVNLARTRQPQVLRCLIIPDHSTLLYRRKNGFSTFNNIVGMRFAISLFALLISPSPKRGLDGFY